MIKINLSILNCCFEEKICHVCINSMAQIMSNANTIEMGTVFIGVQFINFRYKMRKKSFDCFHLSYFPFMHVDVWNAFKICASDLQCGNGKWLSLLWCVLFSEGIFTSNFKGSFVWLVFLVKGNQFLYFLVVTMQYKTCWKGLKLI